MPLAVSLAKLSVVRVTMFLSEDSDLQPEKQIKTDAMITIKSVFLFMLICFGLKN
jgi:hypothetical protein